MRSHPASTRRVGSFLSKLCSSHVVLSLSIHPFLLLQTPFHFSPCATGEGVPHDIQLHLHRHLCRRDDRQGKSALLFPPTRFSSSALLRPSITSSSASSLKHFYLLSFPSCVDLLSRLIFSLPVVLFPPLFKTLPPPRLALLSTRPLCSSLFSPFYIPTPLSLLSHHFHLQLFSSPLPILLSLPLLLFLIS